MALLLQALARSCINSPWLYTDVAVWGGMSCHWCDLFKFMYFTSKWFMLESHALQWDSYFRTIYFQYFQSYISLLLNSIPSYLVNFFQLVAQTRKDLLWQPPLLELLVLITAFMRNIEINGNTSFRPSYVPSHNIYDCNFSVLVIIMLEIYNLLI